MRYKGYVLEVTYVVGSTFRFLKDGRCVDRKPTSKDIEGYDIYDPFHPGGRAGGEATLKEAKARIDEDLLGTGLKNNTLKEWQKLEGWSEEDTQHALAIGVV